MLTDETCEELSIIGTSQKGNILPLSAFVEQSLFKTEWMSSINTIQDFNEKLRICEKFRDEVLRRWKCGDPAELQSFSILYIFNFFYVNFVKKKYFEKLRSVTKVKVWGSPWTAIYGKPGKAFQVNIWHLSHLNFRYLL